MTDEQIEVVAEAEQQKMTLDELSFEVASMWTAFEADMDAMRTELRRDIAYASGDWGSLVRRIDHLEAVVSRMAVLCDELGNRPYNGGVK